MNYSGRLRAGGRTAEITRRIHAAVLKLLTTRGYEACTFQNVAVRAGVERSTVYRRFPDRWGMIIDAYESRAAVEVSIASTGRFAEDLRQLVQSLAQFWSTKLAEAMLVMIVSVRGTPAKDRIGKLLVRRYRKLYPVFDAAIASGDLPRTANRREILERAAGAVIFRVLFSKEVIDEPWIDKLVADFERLYTRPRTNSVRTSVGGMGPSIGSSWNRANR